MKIPHSDSCICESCVEKKARGKLKKPIHVRFPKPSSSLRERKPRTCAICKSETFFSLTVNDKPCCAYCHGDRERRGKLLEVEQERANRAFVSNSTHREEFLEALKTIEYYPVQIRYAISKFHDKLSHPCYRTPDGRLYSEAPKSSDKVAVARKYRKYLIKHFSEVLKITNVNGDWWCCKNRVDRADLRHYLRITSIGGTRGRNGSASAQGSGATTASTSTV
jgi:hypothetical protein